MNVQFEIGDLVIWDYFGCIPYAEEKDDLCFCVLKITKTTEDGLMEAITIFDSDLPDDVGEIVDISPENSRLYRYCPNEV